MPITIIYRHEIAAPPELVWQVLTDLAAYPEWNSFVVSCESTLEPGAPIAMRVKVLPNLAQAQAEIVFENRPGEYLSYGIKPLPLGALNSYRSHRIAPLPGGKSSYESVFRLGGWFAPVVGVLLRRRLDAGFQRMSRELVQRAEALASGPGAL